MNTGPLTEGKTRGSIKLIRKGSNPLPPSGTRPPPPPNPPVNRLIREADTGPYCSQCGSSMKMKYIFIRTENCIQPECNNYA